MELVGFIVFAFILLCICAAIEWREQREFNKNKQGVYVYLSELDKARRDYLNRRR